MTYVTYDENYKKIMVEVGYSEWIGDRIEVEEFEVRIFSIMQDSFVKTGQVFVSESHPLISTQVIQMCDLSITREGLQVYTLKVECSASSQKDLGFCNGGVYKTEPKNIII